MPDRYRIAAVQMNCRLGDPQSNLARIEALLQEARGAAEIACLPELCSTGYHLNALDGALFDLAEPVPGGPTTRRLSALARDLGLALVAGLVERDPHVTGLIYDTAVLLDRRGEFVGAYRKSHLYPDEHRFFRPGDDLPVFELDGLCVGIAICFEHAFPQIFTTLALRGAQVVFNPSAVPIGFGYLQDLRTRARAQDNQMFVVAVNHVGPEGDVTYCGQSQIADPRGDVLARAPGDAEGIVVADVPLALIADQRRQEPIFRGLRPDLYAPQSNHDRHPAGVTEKG
jgi:predicted amidohydrolase